ncbi:LON peptidase N-terminal domain and RING finger 3-like, partial [Olea europaea subsp. europaea]
WSGGEARGHEDVFDRPSSRDSRSAYAMEQDKDGDDEDKDDDGGGEYNNCSICMVRHKGAAFIQCGHTFCRLCSRELCFQQGNFPLCNNYILNS